MKDEKMKIKRTYNTDMHFEFEAEMDGHSYLVIYGEHINGYFCCVPGENWACEMAEPNDVFYNTNSLQSCGAEKEVACCIAAAIKEQCSTSKTDELIYGSYSLDKWNSLSEAEQIAIQNEHEYNLQHEDQADWFVE